MSAPHTPHEADADGNTGWHRVRTVAGVRALLKAGRGADMHAYNKGGLTPLGVARLDWPRSKCVIDVLISLGARQYYRGHVVCYRPVPECWPLHSCPLHLQ
jgi:hypothetical protein